MSRRKLLCDINYATMIRRAFPDDLELARVIAAWSFLSESMELAISAILDACIDATRSFIL